MAEGSCMLLSLPPEIRNSIYELLLTVKLNGNRFLSFGKRPATGYNAKTHTVQAILQTCKQAYNEALHIFYSVNTVMLKHLRVKTFVEGMSVRRMSLIKSIAVQVLDRTRVSAPSFKFLDHLQQLPRLEVLTIILFPADGGIVESISTSTNFRRALQKVGKFPALREIHVDMPTIYHANAGHKLEAMLNSAIVRSKTS